jgi:hypothetical protein
MLYDYCIPSLIDDYKMLKKLGVEVEWVVHVDTIADRREYDGIPIKYLEFHNKERFYENSLFIMKKAQLDGAYLALIAPDNVFARGSIYNAFRLARYKDTSIAIAHPRVLAHEFMQMFPKGRTFGHRELVNIAMNGGIQHPALKYAFDDLDNSFTNQGISIRRMGDEVYAVVHTLPSGVVFKFNASDIQYLSGIPWGEIDRGLSIKLFKEKRIKLVGCSDVCFFVELTRPTHNFSHLYPGLRNNDTHEDDRQNIFNNTIVFWIGEQNGKTKTTLGDRTQEPNR